MNDSTQEGGTLTVDQSPALEAARAEHQKVMTDPAHPHHFGFTRGAQAANDYVYGLYKKALPNPAPVAPEEMSVVTDLSGDDAADAKAELDAALRTEFGENYDAVMRDVPAGAQALFGGDEGMTALSLLSYRITGLGRKAEALSIKFLSDLAKLQS